MKVYGVIKANSLAKLEKRINYLLRNGFDLHGDMKILQQDYVYFQAVTCNVELENFTAFYETEKDCVDCSNPYFEDVLKSKYEEYIDKELQEAKDKIEEANMFTNKY